MEQLIRLDESGMFVQILLREFMEKGQIFALGVINDDFKAETKKFMNFLFNIANREPNQFNELQFHGTYFKVGIILVARLATYGTHGSAAYIYRFNENLKIGISNIYLCSRGEEKVNITIQVSKEICDSFGIIDTPKVFYYNGRYKDYKSYKGVCIVFNNLDKLYLVNKDLRQA